MKRKKNEYSVVWYGKFDIILESIYNYELIARGGDRREREMTMFDVKGEEREREEVKWGCGGVYVIG